jgi:phosphocarrier protein HPr
MQTQEVTVTNPRGLHARASARIVEAASRFTCTVSLVAKGRRASARSILALMLLSASAGTLVELEADGPEEAAAVREIASLFSTGFGERS